MLNRHRLAVESDQDPVRLARGCWVVEPDASELDGTCAAVLRSCNADAVIVSTTAARLYDLWLPDVPDEIHVATVLPDRAGRDMRRPQRREFVAHRWTAPSHDVSLVRGVPVTTPARTWRDLASVLGLPALVAAGDSVLRMGVPFEELEEVVRRTARHRYVRRSRAALELLDARSASRPESHLRVAISAPGIPRFAVNEDVYRDRGGWLARPDLSHAEARIALEYQGLDHADPERMRRDLSRAADLRDEGWLVLAYGPAEVFGRPWQIETEVRLAVRARAPHLVRRPRVQSGTPSG
ncbi:hypothetical protein [Jatrophihabitans sp.]|uniref:hypothetical protein n=1 Tax=Jatrophihabitans sp. TaxID=1932789 RepID=UPI0030C6FE01|nr:hypothetical protein [Jatrophihabitans sp.]